MKRQIPLLAALLLAIGSHPLLAQFGGGGPAGPQLNPALIKLFGEHKAFSAAMEIQVTEGGQGDAMTLPARIAVLDGQTRLEMDLAKATGGKVPPNAAEQMKQLGMDKMVTLSLPEQKVSYLLYPGLDACVELPVSKAQDSDADADFEMEVTELGKEKVAGHDCVKNQVVVTGKDGIKRESTVWNAEDLGKFPVKIETTEAGNLIVLLFQEVKLSKPAANDFVLPPGYTKYDNMMDLMQSVMMKRMGSPPAGN